eukprot:SAG31_NODE_1649_length_7638_cov_19.225096_3_plen_220_part_00
MLALCLHVATAAAAEGLLQVEVDRSTGAYTVELAGQPWLQSGALRFFVNGEWHGVSPTALLPSPPLPTHRTAHSSLQRDHAVPVVAGRLKLQSTPSEPINGTDRFGPYSKLTFDWLAVSSKGATTRFSTSIRSYLDGRTAVFEQSVRPNQSQPIPINPNQSQSIPINPNESLSIPINPYQSLSIPINPNQPQSIPTNPNRSQSIPTNPNQSQPIPINPY